MAKRPDYCDCGRRLNKVRLNNGETGWGCYSCEIVWTWTVNPSGSHWWFWTD